MSGSPEPLVEDLQLEKDCKVQTCKKQRVGVNDAGRRVGESHQNAKLTDDDVRLILELHCYHGMGYAALGVKFESSKSCIQKICNGSRRAKAPVKYR